MSSTVIALPATGDHMQWSEQEKALVEAAGLVKVVGQERRKELAPRPVVEAFLHQCSRTGLDPIARQIYCIERGGKWQTQVSIDGARLVAERTGQYEGQTAPQWSDDGRTWYDAWVAPEGTTEPHPSFARVGVYRQGFREPLVVVARWESYAVYDEEWGWVNGKRQRTGKRKLSQMWAKMPDLMLAKVAEMLALRKAFPQDLSGLYSTEEMQQADSRAPRPPAPTQSAPEPLVQVEEAPATPEPGAEAAQELVTKALAAATVDELKALHEEAEQEGLLGAAVEALGGNGPLGGLLRHLRDRLQQEAAAEAPARDWVAEARVLTERDAVLGLYIEAKAAGAAEDVLAAMEELAEGLPVEGELVAAEEVDRG